MTSLGCESAGADGPAAFDATTETRRVAPTSASVSVRVEAFAPVIALHASPVVSQRSHL
jgi:hypothetical protein